MVVRSRTQERDWDDAVAIPPFRDKAAGRWGTRRFVFGWGEGCGRVGDPTIWFWDRVRGNGQSRQSWQWFEGG